MRTSWLVVLSAILLPAIASAGCPCEEPLRAGWHREAKDGVHVTSASVVVPAPLAEVAAILGDVPSYPSWLFTTTDGATALHDLRYSAETGALSVVLGADAKGEALVATVRTTSSSTALLVSARGTMADVKEWTLDVSARPDAACAERTLVEIRLALTYGLKARLFGGEMKALPSLFALAARDDVASRFLGSPERIACANTAPLTISPATVQRARPFQLDVGHEAASECQRRLASFEGKQPDLADILAVVDEALDGMRPIRSYLLDVAGSEKSAASSTTHGTLGTEARVSPTGLSFHVTASP